MTVLFLYGNTNKIQHNPFGLNQKLYFFPGITG